MKTLLAILSIAAAAIPAGMFASAPGKFEEDVFPTSRGNLTVTFIGHGSLMFGFSGKIIHVDPFGKDNADYTGLPKADIVLITHEHMDHLDPAALAMVTRPGTIVAASRSCAGRIKGAIIMANGESREIAGIRVEAVPAYNILHKRPDGHPYHPEGGGNGYVITFGDKRVYVAGDTEDTPEMKRLKNIDIAFLPMNLPYTMDPEQVAAAARAIKPAVLYPYHYGDTDTGRLTALLKGEKYIDVRIRKLS